MSYACIHCMCALYMCPFCSGTYTHMYVCFCELEVNEQLFMESQSCGSCIICFFYTMLATLAISLCLLCYSFYIHQFPILWMSITWPSFILIYLLITPIGTFQHKCTSILHVCICICSVSASLCVRNLQRKLWHQYFTHRMMKPRINNNITTLCIKWWYYDLF